MLLKQSRSLSAPQVLKWKHFKAHSLQKGGSPQNFVLFMYLNFVPKELRLQNL